LFAICFCIPSYVHHQQLSSVFYLSWELSLCRVSFLKEDLQFSKNFKNTICIGVCTLKCTEKRIIPFTPLHFLPKFVPHTIFKGSSGYAFWNVLYHTSFRNYAPFSLQVPSILSILLGLTSGSRGSRSRLQFWNSLEANTASTRPHSGTPQPPPAGQAR
jgi:hypothetical protein